MEQNIVLEMRDISKNFTGVRALSHVDFTLRKGEIHALMGENGAGKSTTMNIITGYLAATSGEVKINGFVVLKQPEEAKKCVGYLPELPPLYMDMTVKEYLDFVAELKKLEKSLRAGYLKEAMKITKTEEVSGRLIRNLSKGYRQRVGFAQAVLGYPEIIILDEPTVGLDPKQIIEIRDLIKELGKNHTVILSSHILSEVSAVCDYVLIISHGKLVASDTPENLGKLAEGSNTLNLLVKGDKDHIRIALGQISDIKDIKIEDAKEEHAWNVMLSTKEDMDIREEVFFKMADAHCPILEMQSKKVSLEEIFLELTEDDKKKKNEKETDKKEGENK